MAGSPGSEELNEYLSEKYPDRRKRSLAFIKPLEELRKNFDYIFIDCPPSTDNVVRAFLTAADYIIAMQELKRYAMEGTEDFINKVLVPIVTNFEESHLQIIGILPVLSQCDVPLNTQTIKKQLISMVNQTFLKALLKARIG